MLQLKLDHVAHAHVEETRGQSTKKSRFTFCSERLTASVIKSAARTNHAMTSPSLVKRIWYHKVSRKTKDPKDQKRQVTSL